MPVVCRGEQLFKITHPVSAAGDEFPLTYEEALKLQSYIKIEPARVIALQKTADIHALLGSELALVNLDIMYRLYALHPENRRQIRDFLKPRLGWLKKHQTGPVPNTFSSDDKVALYLYRALRNAERVITHVLETQGTTPLIQLSQQFPVTVAEIFQRWQSCFKLEHGRLAERSKEAPQKRPFQKTKKTWTIIQNP